MKSFDSIVRLFKLPTQFVDVYYPYIFYVALLSMLFMFLLNVFFLSINSSLSLIDFNSKVIYTLGNSSNINAISNIISYLILPILSSVLTVLVLFIFAVFLFYSWIDAIYAHVIKGVYLRKKITIEESAKKAVKVVPTVFLAKLIAKVIVCFIILALVCLYLFLFLFVLISSGFTWFNMLSIIGFILLLFLTLFLLSPFFILIVPIIVFEKQSILNSIKSSVVYGKKNYWSFLAFNVMYVLTILILEIAISLLYTVIYIPLIGSILFAALVLVFEAYVFAVSRSMPTVLYLDYVKNSKPPF